MQRGALSSGTQAGGEMRAFTLALRIALEAATVAAATAYAFGAMSALDGGDALLADVLLLLLLLLLTLLLWWL